MPILNIKTNQIGEVGVLPSIAYIATSDTEATVLTAGYLNNSVQNGKSFQMPCIAVVSTLASAGAQPQVGWYQVSHSGANWSLVPNGSPGDVILPTIANHIATYTNTTGTLAEDPATAISSGNIQAGLTTGTAGTFISCPSASAKGTLILAAVANTGNTNVTISNALHGQASVYSIPDSGATTANFILSKNATTQHITVGGLQVDAGALSSGLATGGFVGALHLYPTTTTNGSFNLSAVGNAGNFAATLSDVTGLGQATVYTLPDPANAVARVLVGATATPFTTAHILASSGTGGLVADSGIATSAVQLNTNIKAQQVASLGGAGAGPLTVTAAGCTSSSVVVVSILASSNTVSVSKVAPGTGNFALTLSGDPGATLTISYVMFIAAQ